MEISKLEKELIQLAPAPIYIKQPSHNVKVNEVLAKQISKTLMKIKGRLDIELDEVGNLETDEYIQYRINKKCKTIKSLEFFKNLVLWK